MKRVRFTARVLFAAVAFSGASVLVRAQEVSQSELRELYWPKTSATDRETYVREPMPPEFQVLATPYEGNVFATKIGMTLYTWPLRGLRNGDTGDRKGSKSSCTDKPYSETAGLMSPYPGGLELPEIETRPSCAAVWPPMLASTDSKPVGKWTIVDRENGSRQWAYDGYVLYTSILDKQPGDVFGATRRGTGADSPAGRRPAGPAADVPPEFRVVTTAVGPLVVDHQNYSIYVWDGDAPNKANCVGACVKDWKPILAPETASLSGDWSVVERSPGVKQWAFKGRPVYRYLGDTRTRGRTGSDIPGWHNVFTQRTPEPPPEFTVQVTRSGHVLADTRGRTIYLYRCGDDALDQLACDHPGAPQIYRYAVCGGGDPALCAKMFPPVPAPANVKPTSAYWSVMYIDPVSGKRAEAGQAGAMRIWAFRNRPVYTFARDEKPGDIGADAWGEAMGNRNGYKAFWLRDEFRNNDS